MTGAGAPLRVKVERVSYHSHAERRVRAGVNERSRTVLLQSRNSYSVVLGVPNPGNTSAPSRRDGGGVLCRDGRLGIHGPAGTGTPRASIRDADRTHPLHHQEPDEGAVARGFQSRGLRQRLLLGLGEGHLAAARRWDLLDRGTGQRMHSSSPYP